MRPGAPPQPTPTLPRPSRPGAESCADSTSRRDSFRGRGRTPTLTRRALLAARLAVSVEAAATAALHRSRSSGAVRAAVAGAVTTAAAPPLRLGTDSCPASWGRGCRCRHHRGRGGCSPATERDPARRRNDFRGLDVKARAWCRDDAPAGTTDTACTALLRGARLQTRAGALTAAPGGGGDLVANSHYGDVPAVRAVKRRRHARPPGGPRLLRCSRWHARAGSPFITTDWPQNSARAPSRVRGSPPTGA